MARSLFPLLLALSFAGPTFGQEAETTPEETHDDASPGAAPTQSHPELNGRDIYERVLANRHRTFFQKQRLISGDAGDSAAVTELWTRWKDGHDANGQIKRGVPAAGVSFNAHTLTWS